MVLGDISAWFNVAVPLACCFLPVGSERHAEIPTCPRQKIDIFASERRFKEQNCAHVLQERPGVTPFIGECLVGMTDVLKGFFSDLGVQLG